MLKNVGEVAIAAVLLVLTVRLLRQRQRVLPHHRGFDLVLLSLSLLTVGAAVDSLELQNRAWLDETFRDTLLLLELVVGYLTGILLVGAGLGLSVPALVAHQREVEARLEAERRLRDESEHLRRSTAELEARNESLQLVHDLSGRLHRTLDLETIVRETVSVLVRLTHPPQVAFYLLEEDGVRLRLVADHGFDHRTRDLGAYLPVEGSLSGLALRQQELLRSPDISSDDRLEPSVRAALLARGAVAVTVVPLLYRGQPLGALNLVYREVAALDALDLVTLRAIGHEVSLALANAGHLAGGRAVGVEALVRWQHPAHGLLLPSEFVPLAEVSDLIEPLTCWVLETALGQLHRWRERGLDLTMAVNLSTRNLPLPNCGTRLKELIGRAGVDPAALELEITETALMCEPEAALETLRQVTADGTHLAVDDFGTGYSSLVYLRRLPLDTLKVDRALVADMLRDRQSFAIVESTVHLARSLGLKVVAEGVEDEETADALRGVGCDQAQGFHFARPAPASETQRWLEARKTP